MLPSCFFIGTMASTAQVSFESPVSSVGTCFGSYHSAPPSVRLTPPPHDRPTSPSTPLPSLSTPTDATQYSSPKGPDRQTDPQRKSPSESSRLGSSSMKTARNESDPPGTSDSALVGNSRRTEEFRSPLDSRAQDTSRTQDATNSDRSRMPEPSSAESRFSENSSVGELRTESQMAIDGSEQMGNSDARERGEGSREGMREERSTGSRPRTSQLPGSSSSSGNCFVLTNCRCKFFALQVPKKRTILGVFRKILPPKTENIIIENYTFL